MQIIHGLECKQQTCSDLLNPPAGEAPMTDTLTQALLVSCFGKHRALQSIDFRQFRDDVRDGPPNRNATGTDLVARLTIPPEANVRISYREHRIRATLSSPGIMIGTGTALVLHSHVPATVIADWTGRVGADNDPLTIADIVPGLPDCMISTIRQKGNHVIMEYVDEEIAWREASRAIRNRIEGAV
tara:strand:- start:670 stop:1227 length:558 start_codon:yes stop_codon:yes gene_type:complete